MNNFERNVMNDVCDRHLKINGKAKSVIRSKEQFFSRWKNDLFTDSFHNIIKSTLSVEEYEVLKYRYGEPYKKEYVDNLAHSMILTIADDTILKLASMSNMKRLYMGYYQYERFMEQKRRELMSIFKE